MVDWRGWGGGLLEGAGPGMFFMLNASGVVARSSRWSVYLFIFSVWVDFCLGYKRGLKRRSFSYSVTVGIIYNLAFIENVYFNIRFDTLKWVCTRVRVPA